RARADMMAHAPTHSQRTRMCGATPASSCDPQHLVKESHAVLPDKVIDRNDGEEPGSEQRIGDADRIEPGKAVRADDQETAADGGGSSCRDHQHWQQRAMEADGQMPVWPQPYIQNVPQTKQIGHQRHRKNEDALQRNGYLEHDARQNEDRQSNQQTEAGREKSGHVGTEIRMRIHEVLLITGDRTTPESLPEKMPAKRPRPRAAPSQTTALPRDAHRHPGASAWRARGRGEVPRHFARRP